MKERFSARCVKCGTKQASVSTLFHDTILSSYMSQYGHELKRGRAMPPDLRDYTFPRTGIKLRPWVPQVSPQPVTPDSGQVWGLASQIQYLSILNARRNFRSPIGGFPFVNFPSPWDQQVHLQEHRFHANKISLPVIPPLSTTRGSLGSAMLI